MVPGRMTIASTRYRIAIAGGTRLLRRGRWRPAAFLLGRAVKLAPDRWEAHNNLAVALLKLERWAEAAKEAERAICLDPQAVDSYDFLGIALLRLERWEEAARAYRQALTVDPKRYASYDRLGMALCQLGRWDEVAAVCETALQLDDGHYAMHDRLAGAQLQLRRWDAAAVALRQAIALASQDPAAAGQLAGMQINLLNATAHLDTADESLGDALTAPLLLRAELLHPDTAAHLSRGIELLKAEQWDEAAAELERGSALSPQLGGVHFLRVDPLVRLGRMQEAVAAHQRAVASGGLMPSLPGQGARARFAQRGASFWSAERLGADVFALERWVEALTVVPEPAPAGPGLLFVLDSDFGELTTLKYLVLGQALAGRTRLLLPERLYAHNADALPGRTERYGSVAEILAVVERERPAIVFLCSGYLFCPHLGFAPDDLARLVERLRERGCRVVTADPFLGLLSQHDPRTLIRFEVSREHARRLAAVANLPREVEAVMKARRDAEERGWTAFDRSERILRDTYHLYPSYCDVGEGDGLETDARNVAFFNDRLLRPPQASGAGAARPHWLFILGTADCEVQAALEEETGFADIVARKLVETLAAERHPILIAPPAFLEELTPRLPTAEGIDLLPFCPFTRFLALLLSAEQVFYWNAVSHSLLIRLFNQLPIVQFDRGHLLRTAPGIYDRIVAWYYQGWVPPVRDHRVALTRETAAGWAAEYRPQAARLVERYRRAPSPEALVAELLRRAPTPGLRAEVRAG
jgi:tetratricopeptide (TPR) repeat protein